MESPLMTSNPNLSAMSIDKDVFPTAVGPINTINFSLVDTYHHPLQKFLIHLFPVLFIQHFMTAFLIELDRDGIRIADQVLCEFPDIFSEIRKRVLLAADQQYRYIRLIFAEYMIAVCQPDIFDDFSQSIE